MPKGKKPSHSSKKDVSHLEHLDGDAIVAELIRADPPPLSGENQAVVISAEQELVKTRKKLMYNPSSVPQREVTSQKGPQSHIPDDVSPDSSDTTTGYLTPPGSSPPVDEKVNVDQPKTSQGEKTKWKARKELRKIDLINYTSREIEDDPEKIRVRNLERRMGKLSGKTYTIGPEHIGESPGAAAVTEEESGFLASMWLQDNWDGLVTPCEKLLLDHFIMMLPETMPAREVMERSIRANMNLISARAVSRRSSKETIPLLVEMVESTQFQLVSLPRSTTDLLEQTQVVLNDNSQRMSGLYQEHLVLLNQVSSLVKSMKFGVADISASLEHKSDQLVRRAAAVIGKSDDSTGGIMGRRERTPSLLPDVQGPSTSYSVASASEPSSVCGGTSIPPREDPTINAMRARLQKLNREGGSKR
nr:MAG: hypothetical protein [Mononegavirales sp.]